MADVSKSIPPAFRLTNVPGQVPSKQRMRTLGQVQALARMGANSPEGSASLTLGKLAGRPQRMVIRGEDPFAMPNGGLTEDQLLAHTDPVLSPGRVVDGMGLSVAEDAGWTKFLDDAVAGSGNEVVFRKAVVERLLESGVSADVRRAILGRALSHWRTVKSERFVIDNIQKALYIGPRGGRWADPKHTIPYKAATKIPKPVTPQVSWKDVKSSEPEQAPIQGKQKLGTFQGGDVTAYWSPENQAMVFADTDTGSWLDLATYKPKYKAEALGIAARKLGPMDDPGKTAGTPGWERMPEGEAKTKPPLVIQIPVKPKKIARGGTATGQMGLFSTPVKTLGEEGTMGTKEPVKHVISPPAAPAPKQALTIPAAGRREKAVEIGEHVWGSRADLAVSSANDLKKLSPEDQAKYATKKNLMPSTNVEDLLGADWTPAAIVLRRAIESCVQSKAPNSLSDRQDFMNGIDYLSRSLDGCKTGQDVEDLLHDWMHLATGKKRGKNYSAAEMEGIRREYMDGQGVKQTMSKGELLAAKRERDDVRGNLRMAEIAKMPKSDKKYKQLIERAQELHQVIEIAERAFPQPHFLLKWKLDIPRYGGLSIEHAGNGSVTTYLDAPELTADDNPYESMAKAMGPRMSSLVKTGGTYSTYSGSGAPKVYKDARRVVREMQKESTDKQVEMLHSITGTGTKGVKPKIRRPPYRWERDVPGQINRVGGRDISGADPAALAKDFGFKNVQFGNWVTEDDADTHLRGAHGALFDLADILGVDPKVVGLNGRLSLGIGARGSGKARAHYEPGKQIINITKIAGGGSLAHEWSHALDNIVAVASDPTSTESDMYLSNGATKGVTADVVDAMNGVMAAIRWGGSVEAIGLEQRGRELLSRRSRKERLYYSEKRDIKRYQEALAGKAGTGSKFLEDAQAIGGTGKSSYWSRPHEMFARSFESYVEDTLEDAGRRSSYLVTGTRVQYFTGRDAGAERRIAQPYPQGDERKTINLAIKNMLSVMAKQKTLEKSLMALERFTLGLPERAGIAMNKMIVVTPDELLKADARGGSYYKRTPSGKAGNKQKWRYFYNKEAYDKRDDAHRDGEEAGRSYVAGKVLKCVGASGSKGCGPDALSDLVKKFGAAKIAHALHDHQNRGTLSFKKGKFTLRKEKGRQ